MADKREKDFLDAYEKYSDDIYRHCYFRVYQKQLAEDITQETFIKTWKYISAGKEVKNLRSFLYRVALNLIIDYSRKKKDMYLDDVASKESKDSVRLNSIGQENAIFTHFEAGEVIKALDLLSDAQKEVMVMRYVDEFKPSEISEILGESANAVSVRINQATNRLRAILKEKYGQTS